MNSHFDSSTIKILADLKELKHFFSEYIDEKVFVLMDQNTHAKCLPIIKPYFEKNKIEEIVVEHGEKSKSIDSCSNIWKVLLQKGATRNSLLVNLGGGIISDLGGFVASTFKRGMNFINIPTSLMAMVDAAIGGKNGVNFQNFKNQVGVFCQPNQVFIHPGFLKTLDRENYLSGFAEVIKYAFISSEIAIDYFIENELFNSQSIVSLIRRSAKIKSEIVEKDPFEQNIRKALNFGHTFAHAYESYFADKGTTFLHGYAVAAGIINALYLSHLRHHYPLDKITKLKRFVTDLYGKLNLTKNVFQFIYNAMLQDKKNRNGVINFTLVHPNDGIKINQVCTIEEIEKAYQYYLS